MASRLLFTLATVLALFALVLVVLAEEQEKTEQTAVVAVAEGSEVADVARRHGRRSRSRRSSRRGRGSGHPHQRSIRGWNKLADEEPGSVSWSQRRKYCPGSLRSRCHSNRRQRQIGRAIHLRNGRLSVCCLSPRRRHRPSRRPRRASPLQKARAKCSRRRADVRSFGRCPAGFRRVGRPVSIGRGKKLSCCRFDRSPFRPMSEIPFLVSICQTRRANALRLKCRRNERVVGKPMPFGYKSPSKAVCCNSDCGRVRKPDEPEFKLCGRCKFVRYCSPECQKKAWSSHKPDCKRISSAVALTLYCLRNAFKARI